MNDEKGGKKGKKTVAPRKRRGSKQQKAIDAISFGSRKEPREMADFSRRGAISTGRKKSRSGAQND